MGLVLGAVGGQKGSDVGMCASAGAMVVVLGSCALLTCAASEPTWPLRIDQYTPTYTTSRKEKDGKTLLPEFAILRYPESTHFCTHAAGGGFAHIARFRGA